MYNRICMNCGQFEIIKLCLCEHMQSGSASDLSTISTPHGIKPSLDHCPVDDCHQQVDRLEILVEALQDRHQYPRQRWTFHYDTRNDLEHAPERKTMSMVSPIGTTIC